MQWIAPFRNNTLPSTARDDPRWPWSETTWTTNGSPKGAHNQAHQFDSRARGNANFACVQHFIHHLAPTAMVGFVLVRFFFRMKHGLRRTYSREETGCALVRVPRSVFKAPRFSVAA